MKCTRYSLMTDYRYRMRIVKYNMYIQWNSISISYIESYWQIMSFQPMYGRCTTFDN